MKFTTLSHIFKTKTAFTFLQVAVKDCIEETGIDLVIMGTKGATGAAEVFLGSNTVNIIKSQKKCPVLAIPDDADYIAPTEIAFATDFKRFYSKNEVKPLVDLASIFNATVRIVYVQQETTELTQEQQFNLNMLKKYLQEVKYHQHTVTKGDSVSKSLQLFTEELEIYLLAMLHYKHSFVEKLTREPIVKRIAFHTQIPFLVIPELGMSASFAKNITESGHFEKMT